MTFPPPHAWALGVVCAAGCAFEDPAAIPETKRDPCLMGTPEPDALYASYVENPAIDCEVTTSAAGELDTVIYFTGLEWNGPSAMCRTEDPFHGGLMVSDTRPVRSEPVDITGSLAYCVVGAGSGTEYIVYSLCGIIEPAKAGCELLSQMTGIPTAFESCPGGDLCP